MKSLFAKNLRYLRNKKALSQSALAEKLNYSRSNIASYEFGGSEPNIGRLLEIGKYFNISLDDLLCREIEKAMYDNRIKDKPLLSTKTTSRESIKKLGKEFQSEYMEIESIMLGMKQFLNYKKKKWKNPGTELSVLIQEYEKLLELMEFLISKCDEYTSHLISNKSPNAK